MFLTTQAPLLYIVTYTTGTNYMYLLFSINTFTKMHLLIVIAQDKNMTHYFAVNSEVGKSIKHKGSKLWSALLVDLKKNYSALLHSLK